MPLLSPLDLLILTAAGLVVAELTFLVKRHPAAGVWLLGIGAALSSYRWPPAVVVAGYQTYLLDVLSVVLVLASLLTLAATRGGRVSPALLVVFGLLTLALVRGIAAFGSQTAINATRGLLYVFVAVLFIQVCGGGRDMWPTVRRVWRLGAAVFIVLGALFWLQNGFGTYASVGERALNSTQVLVVAHAGFMALANGRDRRAQLFALVCMVTVLASQQRTVWAATLLTALVLASRSGRATSPALRRAMRGGLAAALVAVVLLLTMGPSDLRESTSAAVAGEGAISTDSGTFGWRVESWTFLLSEVGSRPLADQMVGQPAGTSLERVVAGTVRTESPHNMYVMMVVALGYLGLGALVCLYMGALGHTGHREPLLFAIVLGLCVFSIGYQLAPEHGILLGVALSAGRKSQPVPALRSRVTI